MSTFLGRSSGNLFKGKDPDVDMFALRVQF